MTPSIKIHVRENLTKNEYTTLTSTELNVIPPIGSWLHIQPKKNSLAQGNNYKLTTVRIRLDNNYVHYATDIYFDRSS